jgi:fructokinase
MARSYIIVSIGEVLLAERPDRSEALGLAARLSLAARRLGQVGIPVSRLGQDRWASELLELLEAAGIRTDHLQSDPDLPTGRLVIRPLSRGGGGHVPQPAAFDNLQWDYDLVDLAQQADVVLFGMLAARSDQTRSVLQQLLGECGAALRLLDLTNRPAEGFQRSTAAPLLENADLTLVDRPALAELAPGPERPAAETLRRLLREHDLGLGLLLEGEPDQPRSLIAIGPSEQWTLSEPVDDASQDCALLALLHALRRGLEDAGLGVCVTERPSSIRESAAGDADS